MPAEIETFAYVKRTEADVPWHKLGTPIPEGADSADEIITAAQLDWDVALEPVFRANGDEVANAKAIVRDRDSRVFGVVTDAYEPLQNRDAFHCVEQWLQDGRLHFETAGALGDGSRVFGLARIGEDFYVGGEDQVIPYVILSLRHDGHGGVVVKPCTTRVVCANTLAVAMREGTTTYTIRHTTNARLQLENAARALNLVSKQQAEMAKRFEQLAQTAATEEMTDKVMNLVTPAPRDEDSETRRNRLQRERLALWNTFQNSPTVDRESRWGLFNASTEYLDWYAGRNGATEKSKNDNWRERRALWTLEGSAADVRQDVFNLLTRDLAAV